MLMVMLMLRRGNAQVLTWQFVSLKCLGITRHELFVSYGQMIQKQHPWTKYAENEPGQVSNA